MSAPPDHAARDRISGDLERTFLVEAGAGSGKTTSLVERMAALVRSGACRVEQIAAVTFTRKAAAELRQRFQERLEQVRAAMPPGDPDRGRVDAALRDLDRAFLGTIHAFCAKLLRERPLEAGLDPGFREMAETEAQRMQRAFWVEFLERLAAGGDSDLVELERLGIEPERLQHVFAAIVENPDVDFGFRAGGPIAQERIDAARERFEELLDEAEEMMRGRNPPRGWDAFGRRLRTVSYWRRCAPWDDRVHFFDALARIHLKKGRLTQNRWADTGAGKLRAKRLWQDFRDFAGEAGSMGDELLKAWWACRYPVAIRVAGRAARAFARQRRDRGEINYQDLLALSAKLLRDNPGARADLARRYRRILVDEFQDTDPLQAEILLLLASDPDAGSDWREAVPRPGALFVVGDPKQSIYRFRRADIALYETIKKRFAEFGEVLDLEANFRSLAAFGALVEGVFDRADRFPDRDTDRQASFAPLLTQRGAGRDGPGRLAVYNVEGKRNADAALDDARRVAAAVAGRVRSGERAPGDFMVLTRNRKFLSVYARALEDHGLPVEVSGAAVGFEDEIGALLLLFRALADPAHEVRALGVLTGPLFGISLDRLVAFRDGGGSFAINRPPGGGNTRGSQPPGGGGQVAEALATLHRWWTLARREPADLTAERLVAETGLFPLAAAGQLGQLRAGALVYLLDAVRARALAGDTSLAGAVDALETALDWDDAEAPLVPGRPNCVQVMNLHRAKGLEAKVVFLAGPFGDFDRPPQMRVSRDETGAARGTVPIVVPRRRGPPHVIAQPRGWDEDQAVEAEFEKAEKVRLLYVAATRARDELWIARWPGAPRGKWSRSPWAPLAAWVAGEAGRENPVASAADLPLRDPPEREALDEDDQPDAALAAAREGAAAARASTYRLDTVTGRAKGGGGDADARGGGAAAGAAYPAPGAPADSLGRPRIDRIPAAPPPPAVGGFGWGSAVHAVLAAAAAGSRGEALAQVARAALVEFDRPVDETGAPTELDELLALVDSVRDSAIWKRAAASGELHAEAPFALNRGGPRGESPGPDVVEGVIDLVFKDGDSWVVADYKTDSGEDPDFADRVERYRAQVDLYADCWEALTGEPVGERVLVFTSQGRTESW